MSKIFYGNQDDNYVIVNDTKPDYVFALNPKEYVVVQNGKAYLLNSHASIAPTLTPLEDITEISKNPHQLIF